MEEGNRIEEVRTHSQTKNNFDIRGKEIRGDKI